ncbi:D-hexose-6-phosphate mutarotase [Kocuria tytonicola]|uniref:Putative glucose-6-phosphate 1-epimerase n=1 Tax=Kocuria tytonicola TaxID=2055946 RepID=A0A3L9L5I5_9MICC|nr:D-hexose-6-phosphate mutarotase [Kocuria tytonicola]RLY94246.1 D-hexose-6-phosphate mutarotase [Kocuria tytonicola]
MTRLPEPLSLTSAAGSGAVLSHGAHAVSWAPEGRDPVLWMSSRAHNETGRAIRGGVPICFPWFGPGRTGDMEPAHGFARTAQWQLVEQGQDEHGNAFAEFTLSPQDVAEELRAAFPHEFRARLRMTVGERLRLELTVTNTGSETFEMEEALHTYLHVGDSRRISVSGLAGASYFDKVAKEQRTQVGDLTITGETDAVFAHRGEVRVTDPALERVLVVSKEGSDSTVVWNPWADKAVGMSDFADDEWKTMLCVEAGNVMGSPVRLAAGEAHTIAQVIAVQDLPAERA